MEIPLMTSSTIVPVEKFWESVQLYHDRPHLINRRIVAVSQLLLCQISTSLTYQKLRSLFTREALLFEIRKNPTFDDFLTNITSSYDKNVQINKIDWKTFSGCSNGIFISVRVLMGRKDANKAYETVLFNKTDHIVTFFAIQEREKILIAPDFPYHIELNQGNLRILLESFEDADTSSAEWLADKLFPKLLKWSEDFENPAQEPIKSLSLINSEHYCLLYNNLKTKYGDNLVKRWSEKASTDPKKFVFEDLAIASYLICLWSETSKENINFVDCGAGNGLLVYILNQEGYKGCGLDIRSRAVWELFENKADLKVETVTPQSRFGEATWILGNHSDELTPWIPIIALNSSPKTNFFVLPCCPYDFSGRKFVRTNSKISQYSDYLHYIKGISIRCGFETSIDKMRIPSTKRTCLVGIRENFENCEEIKMEIEIFVDSRLTTQFKARNSVEQVRNCTKLERNLIQKITGLISEYLLSEKNYIQNHKGEVWNQGGCANLDVLSKIVPTEDLKSLKNECGGLQTLLKNHRYIFNVDKGTVKLRHPLKLTEETAKYRDKPCWFFGNHPNGCLFKSEECASSHR